MIYLSIVNASLSNDFTLWKCDKIKLSQIIMRIQHAFVFTLNSFIEMHINDLVGTSHCWWIAAKHQLRQLIGAFRVKMYFVIYVCVCVLTGQVVMRQYLAIDIRTSWERHERGTICISNVIECGAYYLNERCCQHLCETLW